MFIKSCSYGQPSVIKISPKLSGKLLLRSVTIVNFLRALCDKIQMIRFTPSFFVCVCIFFFYFSGLTFKVNLQLIKKKKVKYDEFNRYVHYF